MVLGGPLLAGSGCGSEGAAGEATDGGTATARERTSGYAVEVPGDLPARIGAAVAAMVPLVPVDPATRVAVVVERDHVEQIRNAGTVGEAVAGPGGIHLVYHPRDVFAYRQAVGRVLLERAGLAEGLPPYLVEGAALWLSGAAGGEVGAATAGEWYGRPWHAWLDLFAAAGVLPTVDELLAAEEPPDGSRLLWTPVAAAVVESLPGDTAAAKLEQPPAALREAAAALLARFEAEGAAVRRAASGMDLTDRDAAEPSALFAEGFAPAADSESRRPPPAVPARDPLPAFLAGVSLAMLNDHALGYQAPSVDRALLRLRRDLAANAVSLMPFAYQEHPDRPAMRYLNRRPGSETDAAMIHAGRRAGARGFVVLWKPQIWLRGSWPGEIAMSSEADWQAWFRAYRRFVVHQAVLARWTGAELFSVGVELGDTVHREADWRRLIAAVRRVYDGPLTYAANWYGDFDRVPFWDALDFLGIDAYEPLSDDPEATPDELAAGAARIVENLAAGARRHRKPLLLTELGYAAHEAAWVAPHEEGGPPSEADQAAAYGAFLGALGSPAWLRGVFVWKAFSNAAEPGGGGRHRRGDTGDRADFRFLDRPAREVIHDYYATP
jgi:hypothetical protein